MPTYQYACTACGEQLEAVQKFTDDPLTVCAVCGGRLRKIFSPVGIVFKGSGFYRTDSRNSASVNGSKPKESSGAAASSSGDKPAGGDSASEAKPAKKEAANGGSAASGSTSAGSASGDSAGAKVA